MIAVHEKPNNSSTFFLQYQYGTFHQLGVPGLGEHTC